MTAALHRRLYPAQERFPSAALDPEYLRTECARPGVTLQLLWEEYRALHPDRREPDDFLSALPTSGAESARDEDGVSGRRIPFCGLQWAGPQLYGSGHPGVKSRWRSSWRVGERVV